MNRATVMATVIGAALAGPALGADDFRWQGRLASGAAIEIKGVNGKIRADGAAGDAVEVTATKRAKHGDAEAVEIRVVEHAGGVTICALHPSPDGKPNVCAPGEGGRMSVARGDDVLVDFQVAVPAGVRFVGRSVNGGVTAGGLTADSELVTVNGSVEVETRGVARAQTVNGAIRARLGRADWTGQLSLRTVNGSIDVALPADASSEVHASTVHGRIRSDFPLASSGGFVGRTLQGTIGSGGRSLELKTVNGAIALRKGAGGV